MAKKKNQTVPEPKVQKAESSERAELFADNKIEILYYTDPLCCWSWAFEPHWQRLREEYKVRITWKYCMGGLIPDWKNFHDSLNSVTRPVQMGPVWMHAAQVAGVTINHKLWMEDPPASSYPACVAVKCAELQSQESGDIYLSLLRRACMLDGQNIAKKDILMQIARDMSIKYPGLFDEALFKKDFGTRGLEAFKKDLQQTHYHNIHRFPSLIIRSHQRPPVLLSGYIPYNVLINTIEAK